MLQRVRRTSLVRAGELRTDFVGLIDPVRIYDRAVRPQQKASIWQTDKGWRTTEPPALRLRRGNALRRALTVLWTRGGAPGQGIVAQQGSGNWLYLNPADGSLMTGLTGSGQNARPLYSDVVITDDQWHRIGLVWDGARRLLCVDGEEAASDEQDGLLVSGNGLNIGCDCNLAPGSFFSGLVDDIRIYNRAVKP